MAKCPTEAVIPGPPEGWNPESRDFFSGCSGFRVALRLPGMTKLRFVTNQELFSHGAGTGGTGDRPRFFFSSPQKSVPAGRRLILARLSKHRAASASREHRHAARSAACFVLHLQSTIVF